LLVSIENADGEVKGYLSFRGADGAETERSVTGDTCGEVVSALALIAAIAIDPDAAARSPDPEPKAEAPAGPTPAPVASASPPIAAPAPAPAPVRPPEPAAPSPDGSATQAARANPRSWHFAIDVGAALGYGVAPSPLFSTPVGLEASAPTWGPLSPVGRVRFEHAATGVPRTTSPAGTFSWTVGVLELCPNRWKTGHFAIEPCARFEGGVVNASGVNVVPARETTKAWFTVGAVGRVEWRLLDPVFIALEGGVRVALDRPTYFFEPNAPYYEPPRIGGFGSVGVGAQFL
jgi:hypothetical protein